LSPKQPPKDAAAEASPLAGLVVADFSRVLAGPLCTQMLGDAGARVIKVEEPEAGDETRRWGPPFLEGISSYFLSINRHKESLALDLRRGGAIARRLIEQADVVVDNFLPAQQRALGLTADDVRTINPRAVHCSIAGFDSDTPEGGAPGYDLLAQAGAGLMAITGEATGEPMKIGVALADILTAHHAFGAICAALVSRERSGRGAHLEVSLFSSTLASLANVGQAALLTGREPGRFGNAHAAIVPYELFHGSDRPFAIGAGTNRHFRQLCTQVIERPELADDERFATNEARVNHRQTLVPLLEQIFCKEPAAHWLARCREAAIPCSLVQGVLEALQSPAGAPLVGTLTHPTIGEYQAIRYPVRFDGVRTGIGTPPPELGANTDRVLGDLGYTPGEIEALRAEEVIGPRTTSAEGPGSRSGRRPPRQ
jgi:crotonobetainyl-CoA:carnitine CoA-transferase CaiB-like acyl-CoA transferase